MKNPICPKCKSKMNIEENKATCPNCNFIVHKQPIQIRVVRIPLNNSPQNINNLIQGIVPELKTNSEKNIFNSDEMADEIIDGFIETMNGNLKNEWNKIKDGSKDTARIVWKVKLKDILEKYI